MEEKKEELTQFSQTEISRLATLKTKIDGEVKKMEKGAMGIATALSEIYEGKLYKIDGYKNVYEYAAMEHGLSRGMVSNIINVTKRFAVDGKIPKEIADYGVKALSYMKDYEDSELFGDNSLFHITPDMTATDIVGRISEYEKSETPKDNNSAIESVDRPEKECNNSTVEQNDSTHKSFKFPEDLQDFRKFFNENMQNIKYIEVTM